MSDIPLVIINTISLSPSRINGNNEFRCSIHHSNNPSSLKEFWVNIFLSGSVYIHFRAVSDLGKETVYIADDFKGEAPKDIVFSPFYITG